MDPRIDLAGRNVLRGNGARVGPVAGKRMGKRVPVEAYVLEPLKAPWYIDLLNVNLNVTDLSVAEERIRRFLDAFGEDGTRITRNLDFDSEN